MRGQAWVLALATTATVSLYAPVQASTQFMRTRGRHDSVPSALPSSPRPQHEQPRDVSVEADEEFGRATGRERGRARDAKDVASFFLPEYMEEDAGVPDGTDASVARRSVVTCSPARGDSIKLATGRAAFLACTNLLHTSSLHAISTMAALSDTYDRLQVVRLIDVPLGGGGRSFQMYVTKDYVSTSLVKYGVFAPGGCRLASNLRIISTCAQVLRALAHTHARTHARTYTNTNTRTRAHALLTAIDIILDAVFTTLVHEVTYNGCRHEPQTVVDLGCNLGLYSLAALRNGCNVVCVEPNRDLTSLIVRSVLRNLNSFDGSAVVLQAAAGAAWHEITLTTDAGANPDRDPSIAEVRDAQAGRGSAFALPVGDYISGDVLLLKVDVEWLEKQAGLGLNRWLRTFAWRHLTIEVKVKDQAAVFAVFLQGCRGLSA